MNPWSCVVKIFAHMVLILVDTELVLSIIVRQEAELFGWNLTLQPAETAFTLV